MYKRKLIVICCFFLALTYISGDSVSISEINNSSLLVNQTIKVNVNVTDRNGKPVLDLDKDNFRIFETPEGGEEKEREILAFEEKVNMDQGINMMLLLDNSRSMYSNDSGTIEDSPNEEIWRITHAKKAILSLLEEVDNSRDKIGLVPFNVKIGKSTRPKNNIRRLKKVLGQIEKPGKGEGYTELYESLHHTVGALSRSSGRKAIILLSDGENYPLANNRNFQEREGINGAIRYAQEEGVSVFTIGFGRQADEASLRRIAGETGGLFFRARNQRELEALYKLIREQILNEYRITYRAGMEPADRKIVRIQYNRGRTRENAQRFYYSDTMFGIPQNHLSFWIFLLPLLCALLLWLLSRLKFEKKKKGVSLEVLTMNGKKTKIPELDITEAKSQITIGSGKNADMTIVGDSSMRAKGARIVKKGGQYTVVGENSPITVNNRRVKSKGLRSGDLITVGNTTIVFDTGMMGDKPKRKK